MKKSIITIIIICLILLSSCSKENNNTETDSGFLVEPEAFRYQDNIEGFFETEYGEYAFNYLPENEKIYFSESGKHEFYLLCNKPDCSHRDENCNAYGGIAVGYYNDHIYNVYLNESKGIFMLSRMNMDGTGHEEIMELPKIEDKITGASTSSASTDSLLFNEGYLYMIDEDNLSSKNDTTDVIYKINLDTKEISSLFADCFKDYRYVKSKMFGNTFYMVIDDKDPENKYETTRTHSCHLVKADTDTGEFSIIINDWPWIGGIPPVERDGILYYHRPGIGYCEYDLTSGQETVKLEADLYLSQTSYTDKYIFAREKPNIPGTDMRGVVDNWVFKVYNYDYECLNTLEKGSFVKFPTFLYTARDVLYFSSMSDHTITHYAEISKVGTDDFQLIPVPNAVDPRSIVKSD